MQSKLLWALALLNVLLAALFISQLAHENTALAQFRRPPDVVAIPGQAQEERSGIVYLLDTTNGQLGGMVYDTTRKTLVTMPPVDLVRLFEAAEGTKPAR